MDDRDRESNYIGSGVSFPLDLNVQSKLKLSKDNDNVRESIKLILGTSLGERAYRPDFGSRLSELVFEPLNLDTLLKLRLYVREALERWEPRIILEAVTAEPDPISGKVTLTIQYRLKNNAGQYDTRNLVYPFYLESKTE